ncbi:hypothetical protein ABZX12_26265 [Kribbella sp. NPDC003505]|uniref:hypothetical protein n=1 Tax=Kribbella sp. NPDC003505 TaxID=3154448 RepID=UPI0033B4E58B
MGELVHDRRQGSATLYPPIGRGHCFLACVHLLQGLDNEVTVETHGTIAFYCASKLNSLVDVVEDPVPQAPVRTGLSHHRITHTLPQPIPDIRHLATRPPLDASIGHARPAASVSIAA